MELRKHQKEKAEELLKVLNTYKCAYLRGEVRSGKTLTVMQTAKLYGVNKVLFITKKKAISSINSDYEKFNFPFYLTVTNYESIHKISGSYELIIYDESHTLGGFPKPAKRVKTIRSMFSDVPCIWLSGTPAAESKAQLFHQFFVSDYGPFKKYANFYKWAKDYIDVKEKRIGTHTVKDYSNMKPGETEQAFDAIVDLYSVIMTQQDAGFNVNINEQAIYIDCPDNIHRLVERLIKDRAIEGKNGFIMADMPAKLQSKVHQIYNGSVILETLDGNTKPFVLSSYKAEFIKERFKGQKIAIMYYYKAELDILEYVFGYDITTDLNEFNKTDVNLAIQQSSTEGMNISAADCLVYYNMGFSGKAYIQSRDRLTVKDRKNNDVYFIIETPGINGSILETVREKKDFNNRLFKKVFL